MNPRALLALLCLCIPARAQWHQPAPANTPPVRHSAAMTYDRLNGVTWLFGGAALPTGNRSDTWSFDGSDWTQFAPATSPPGRAGCEMVSDFGNGGVLLYGGLSPSLIGGPSLDDTWRWNGVDWQQLSPAHSPGGRGRYGMAYDPLRNRTVLYGGVPNSLLLGVVGGTWEFDGVDWQQVATTNSPGPLQDPAMCYSVTLQRVVLFGGSNPLTGINDLTWTYDGTNWTQVPVTSARPAARAGARLIYDDRRGSCVLHGGSNASGTQLNDTWVFDAGHWIEVAGSRPPARRGTGFAFDLGRDQGVLFGGTITPTQGATDTWEYDGGYFAAIGNGCAGGNGVAALQAIAGPRLGHTFVATLTGLLPTVPVAIVLLGFNGTNWNGLPLPADLTAVGLTSCTLYTSLDIVTAVPASGGFAVHGIFVPNSQEFLGVPFLLQGLSLDPLANPFGATLSNAGLAIIGA